MQVWSWYLPIVGMGLRCVKEAHEATAVPAFFWSAMHIADSDLHFSKALAGLSSDVSRGFVRETNVCAMK
jgi:hypothetical protein